MNKYKHNSRKFFYIHFSLKFLILFITFYPMCPVVIKAENNKNLQFWNFQLC